MSNPKISVQIGIAGLSEMRTAMRSAVKMSEEMNTQIRHIAERTAKRVKELEEDRDRLAQRSANKRVQIEEDFNRRIARINERAALSQKQFQERAAVMPRGGASISGLGHLAQAAGFYRTGHIIRGIGAGISVGSEMGAGTMIAAGAALGGIVIAAKLVEVAFGAVKDTAMSFVSAISQIGGARNLQEMIVEGASTERKAAQIAANAADKISTKEVLNIVNNLSKNSEFKPEDVAGGMRAFVGKTGEAGLFGQIGSFATELSTVSGMSMQETGGLLGQLRAQFNLGPDQIKQAAASLWMQGRAGTVELKDAQSISQALGFSRMAGKGDIMKGMSSEMGAVQLAQKGLGGTSADEAVTAIRRFQEDLTSKNAWKIQNQIGGGPMTGTDASGNRVFTNFQETLARSALTYLKKGTINGMEERAMRVPRGIAEFAAQTEEFKGAKSDKDKLKVIEDVIEKYSEQKVVLDELDGAFKDIKETVDYQLKQSFNQLSIELESLLLPVLKVLVPMIKQFADAITDNKPQIEAALKSLLDGVIDLTPKVVLLMIALGQLISWILSFVPSVEDQEKALETHIAQLKEGIDKDKFVDPNDPAKKEMEDEQKQLDRLKMIERMQKQAKEMFNPPVRTDDHPTPPLDMHDKLDQPGGGGRFDAKHQIEVKMPPTVYIQNANVQNLNVPHTPWADHRPGKDP